MKKNSTAIFMSRAAVIAALYVVLTYVSALLGLSSGPIQCRLSEALCILPVFTSAAVPGLFVGCLLSNLLTGCIVWDVVFGSIATLIGAAGTYALSKTGANKFLLVLPPVLSNTVIVPLVLKFAYALDGGLWYFVATVFVGEVISCAVLGLAVYHYFEKHHKKMFLK